MRRIFKSGTFWFALAAVALLVVGVVSTVFFWGWLHPKDSQTASNSETVRNVGLLIGGVLAFVFALWRGWVAERQAATAESGLLNDRFQKGAEMLGSEVLAVRIGGIYGLTLLAREYPQRYHVQVMRLFCSFARDTLPSEVVEEDAKAVMDAIGARRERHLRLERDAEYWLNLSGASLQNANLQGADLSSLDLPIAGEEVWQSRTFTDLSRAHFFRVNLELANLKNADLSGTDLSGAILSGVDFKGTNLSGAKFSYSGKYLAMGLTQSQLDDARADPNNPPQLDGVVDADTGIPLVWRGRSLKDDADGDR